MHVRNNELILSNGIQRLWGFYIDLYRSDEHTMKFLVIKDGLSISCQKHNLRSEKWEIVDGCGHVYLQSEEHGIKTFDVKPGDTFTVAVNEWHQVRAANGDLIVYEHQYGSPTCSEEDIIRVDPKI